MLRTMLKAKLHTATVTGASLDYEGSLGLDGALLDAAGMIPFEKVHVYNVTNGERLSTYLIRERAGSGRVEVYGAAAHKIRPGDKIIIAAFAQLADEEIAGFVPKIILLDGRNRIKTRRRASRPRR